MICRPLLQLPTYLSLFITLTARDACEFFSPIGLLFSSTLLLIFSTHLLHFPLLFFFTNLPVFLIFLFQSLSSSFSSSNISLLPHFPLPISLFLISSSNLSFFLSLFSSSSSSSPPPAAGGLTSAAYMRPSILCSEPVESVCPQWR